jgi:excisionase family DNA binding protein
MNPSQIPFFENLLTKKQLAQMFCMGVSTISKLMDEHGLPHVKIGRSVRFRVSDVEAWLQKRRQA